MTKYYRLTPEGKLLLKEYLGIDDKAVNKWVRSIEKDELNTMIDKALGFEKISREK